MRRAKVYVSNEQAGIITEYDDGYLFQYDEQYIISNGKAVSLTMPLQKEAYKSKVLFPFFDGLIPEGWLLSVVSHNWKISTRDRFGIMLVACADPIGNVSIREISDEVQS